MASNIDDLAQEIKAMEPVDNFDNSTICSMLEQLRDRIRIIGEQSPFPKRYEDLIKIPETCIDLLEGNNNSQQCFATVREIVVHLCDTVNKIEAERKSRNTFRNINMGDSSLLALLSPKTPGTFMDIHSGRSAIQFLHVMPGHGPPGTIEIKDQSCDEYITQLVQEDLLSSVSRFNRIGPTLERRDTDIFRNIHLGEREVMLILSSAGPITVAHVTGEAGSVLIAGEASFENIGLIARTIGVRFDDNQGDGIFQSTPIR